MNRRSTSSAILLFWGTALCAFQAAASADTPGKYPDARASDPAVLGWMVGAPPPADRVVRFDDGTYFRFPQWRWSVSNFRQLMPTVNVSRGTAAPSRLEQAVRDDIDSVTFYPLGSDRVMTWAQSLEENYTDGIIVLHRGRVVHERYFGVLKPDGHHGAMSVTKTFVGTLAALLAAEGALDPQRKVADYVPELSGSAFLLRVPRDGAAGRTAWRCIPLPNGEYRCARLGPGAGQWPERRTTAFGADLEQARGRAGRVHVRGFDRYAVCRWRPQCESSGPRALWRDGPQ